MQPTLLKNKETKEVIIAYKFDNLWCTARALDTNGRKVVGEISDYLIEDFHIYLGSLTELTDEQKAVVAQVDKWFIDELIKHYNSEN